MAMASGRPYHFKIGSACRSSSSIGSSGGRRAGIAVAVLLSGAPATWVSVCVRVLQNHGGVRTARRISLYSVAAAAAAAATAAAAAAAAAAAVSALTALHTRARVATICRASIIMIKSRTINWQQACIACGDGDSTVGVVCRRQRSMVRLTKDVRPQRKLLRTPASRRNKQTSRNANI